MQKLYIVLTLTLSLHISASAIECNDENLLGEWSLTEVTSGVEHEIAACLDNGDCSKPGRLYGLGWTGRCEWQSILEKKIRFHNKEYLIIGAREVMATNTGIWRGRISYSNNAFNNIKDVQSCQTPEVERTSSALILKSGQIEQEVLESFNPSFIGKKYLWNCVLNGYKDQIILSDTQDDGNIEVFKKVK